MRSSQAIAAMVRAPTSSPLSLSVLMSPFSQKVQRMLQEVKKMVPVPSVPAIDELFARVMTVRADTGGRAQLSDA